MKSLTVNLKNEEDLSYPIIIERGIVENIENYLSDDNPFVITNDRVSKIYPEFLKKFNQERIIIIKDGEKYKNLKTIEYILNALLERKIERKNSILAFGGGVVGDMAGYCASCILRGVNFVQVPTTLLAQVDSSVGGKTGFNTEFGKNLVGAFWQPKKVLIDPNVLKTLSLADFKSGLGEVIKYAFIEKSCGAEVDFDLMNLFCHLAPAKIDEKIEEIIFACTSLKAAVVEKDEKEGGLRAILNLGHTWAHAIEKITNYKKYSHGQAVAMGIKMALYTALSRELISEEYYNIGIGLIEKFDIAPKKASFKPKKILEIMKSDKKVKNSKINLILPLEGRKARLFDDTDELLIEESLL